MAEFVKFAKASEVPSGTGKVVEVGGRTIALFNRGGVFSAIDNECKHRGGPLGEGSLEGTVVTCPWHGWEYEVTSGACRTDPSIAVETFEVKVEGDDVLVRL